MSAVPGNDRHHTRCLKFQEIDWNAPLELAEVKTKGEIGEVVLKMDKLKKYYQVAANAMFGGGDTKVVKANEELTFEARESETLAIVGESGCGKSTFAKVLMGLETATEGQILLNGESIGGVPIEKRTTQNVADVQMVFQNPFDTLNPSMTVGRQIIRALEIFKIGKNEAERKKRMMEIQREHKTTLLFISHDLSIVRYLSDRVMVMYLGHVVELGDTDQVFSPPYHPYTEALLSAVPIADTRVKKKHIVLEGDIPSAMNPPPGCPFQTRCRWKSEVPGGLCDPMRVLADGHQVKCHLSDQKFAEMEPVIEINVAAE